MAEEEEKKEDSVYDEEGREKLVEEGEISPEEAGFMKGYEEANKEKIKEAKPESEEDQEMEVEEVSDESEEEEEDYE